MGISAIFSPWSFITMAHIVLIESGADSRLIMEGWPTLWCGPPLSFGKGWSINSISAVGINQCTVNDGNARNRNTNGDDLLCEDRVANRGVSVHWKRVNKKIFIFFHQRLNWLNGNWGFVDQFRFKAATSSFKNLLSLTMKPPFGFQNAPMKHLSSIGSFKTVLLSRYIGNIERILTGITH